MNGSTPCRIEPYCAAHVEDVCRIDRLCFIDPWLKRSFIEESEAPGAVSGVALPPNDPVPGMGYCLGRVAADEYTILRLAVHPDFQRRGIATRLLQICMQRAVLGGALNCFIETRTGNTAARNLYETLGFITIGTRRAYYQVGTEDAILMQCALSPLHHTAHSYQE